MEPESSDEEDEAATEVEQKVELPDHCICQQCKYVIDQSYTNLFVNFFNYISLADMMFSFELTLKPNTCCGFDPCISTSEKGNTFINKNNWLYLLRYQYLTHQMYFSRT